MTFKTVYLIRHAAPQKGTGIPYDVPPGPPLSEAGQREARQMAEFLAGRGIQRIVHSPLDRTAMTAEALGSRLGLPVVEAADLALDASALGNPTPGASPGEAAHRLRGIPLRTPRIPGVT